MPLSHLSGARGMLCDQTLPSTFSVYVTLHVLLSEDKYTGSHSKQPADRNSCWRPDGHPITMQLGVGWTNIHTEHMESGQGVSALLDSGHRQVSAPDVKGAPHLLLTISASAHQEAEGMERIKYPGPTTRVPSPSSACCLVCHGKSPRTSVLFQKLVRHLHLESSNP